MTDSRSNSFHYFLHLAYDGTAYRGWQRQPHNVVSVQQTLEECLSEVHGREIVLGGCGRTDAGVHASQYYAYLRAERPLQDKYVFIVNKRLPNDITLHAALPVPLNSQARYDATERTYDYFLHGRPDAFLGRFSGQYDFQAFDPEAVAATLPLLLKHQDFRAFCKTPDRHNTTIVKFRQATLYRTATGDRYRLRFVANRFLRGMIRLLVNDLMLVGTGKLSQQIFAEMLKTGVRQPHFQLAPSEGLFLTGVSYPYIDREAELPVSGQIIWHEIPYLEG
ncbi:tRNA pseudouridine synthase A [Neolewinella persica]|uniref:tRNA pseudouridine synthase A n=1 Tax=Neolewinella persica TaxID=70998 RepID=UPI0003805D1E|nr:tRNA pseudouridine synthase A [Neolewinella persica]